MSKTEFNNFIETTRTSGTGSHTKALKAEPQDFTSGDNGIISGYFATFDHDHGDSYGDVILKNAFKGTIERRKKTGHPFPLCFNHDFSCIIGRVTDIGEDNKGAYFTAEFFPTEKAQEVRSIVKSGVLWQFSFAYDTLDAGKVKAGDGTIVNELRELELYEISVVAVPANPRATLTDIKTDNATESKLSPEIKTKRDELLSFIEQIKTEERAARTRLLRYINDMKKDDAEAQLKKYRDMEAQALKDIGKAEAEGLTEWKQMRMGALAAIRREIKRLEEAKRHKTGDAFIKTGSRPLTEPKAKIK